MGSNINTRLANASSLKTEQRGACLGESQTGQRTKGVVPSLNRGLGQDRRAQLMELSHVSQTQCMLAAQPSCARNAQTSRRAPSGQAWAGAGPLDAGQALPSLGAWSTSLADSA